MPGCVAATVFIWTYLVVINRLCLCACVRADGRAGLRACVRRVNLSITSHLPKTARNFDGHTKLPLVGTGQQSTPGFHLQVGRYDASVRYDAPFSPTWRWRCSVACHVALLYFIRHLVYMFHDFHWALMWTHQGFFFFKDPPHNSRPCLSSQVLSCLAKRDLSTM